MNKILTYDYERTIRACYAEVKSEDEKTILINEALAIMKTPNVKFYKYEDSVMGTLIGYGIYDENKNSLKSFTRPGK